MSHLQVGLLLTILLGHGIIDKLTLRHSRLAQVAQLKDILQLCANSVEETVEVMDTQESVVEFKGESSHVDSHVQNFAFQGQDVKSERSLVRGHPEFLAGCRKDSSDNLPLKIAKTDMSNVGGQRSDLNKQGEEVHFESYQCESIASGFQQGYHSNRGEGSSTCSTQQQQKPDDDLFDYCFTEPIKSQDNKGTAAFKCPSKRLPHFGMQIPKKKHDFRHINERLRPCTSSARSPIECQLCRSLQYQAVHKLRAITHIVLLGFSLDVRDCVAIGEVLSDWTVLKRIELVDNCKYNKLNKDLSSCGHFPLHII